MTGLLVNLDFIFNVNESHEKTSRKQRYIMIEDQFGGDKFKKTISKKDVNVCQSIFMSTTLMNRSFQDFQSVIFLEGNNKEVLFNIFAFLLVEYT